jgi:hypothetical protein
MPVSLAELTAARADYMRCDACGEAGLDRALASVHQRPVPLSPSAILGIQLDRSAKSGQYFRTMRRSAAQGLAAQEGGACSDV